MKKFKILKAAVILCTLLYAITGIVYADINTTTFTDIDNSWARQHIINVYNKGLMGGFSETEFKPGNQVKNYDALVSISRMVNGEKDINLEQLEEIYQASVLDKFNVPEYAREHILVCLHKNIVTDADIGQFAKYPYATKNNIVKYLGMAFGVTVEEGAPPTVLAFKDSMYVPTLYKPYVKFLIDNGIINGSGDANGNFNPADNIDRAAFAKMMDLSSNVYNKKVLGLDTAVTDTGSTDTGDDSEVIWTDTDDTDSDIDDTDYDVAEADGVPADVTAYVDQAIPEYGNLAVFVGTERRIYRIAEDAACTIDGVSSGFWKLKKSDLVKLYIEADKVVRIVGESKIKKTVGTLMGIKSEDKTILTMKTQSGETRNYTIAAKTIVIKDGKSALWQELKNGNSLVITTSYDELLEINADGVKSSDKGVIESLVYSRIAPPQIVITTPDGSQNTYYVNEDMEINGAGGDVHSLRPGMQVDVSLIDDEISKVAVINETALVQLDIKGIIKSIDTGSQLVVVEIYDSNTNKYTDKNIFITADTKIVYVNLNTLEINSLGIDNLKPNQTISIVGDGTADGVIAKTIQLIN
jgi:hypothetical protein